MAAKRICLGVIAAVHGVRGQVKIKSFTQTPEDIFEYGPLSDAEGRCFFKLKPCGISGGTLLASIDNITSREAAEALKGTKLYIERSSLPEPDEDEFYIEDLVGLKVVTPDNTPFGIIVAIENYGAGDLLEIESLAGDKNLYAFTRKTFPNIDMGERTITIDQPEEIIADEPRS